MPNNSKKERFKKITAARISKIDDMLRLIGNCSNKNNYSYTDSDVEELFSALEKSVEEAKSKYEYFLKQSDQEKYKYDFEQGYTWIAGFMRNVLKYPNKSALICPKTGEIWSYRELNEDINRLAAAMKSAGVKRRDKVVYQLGNSPEFVFVYAACHKIGAVGCPIYTNLAPAKTAAVIDSVKPKIFFYTNNGNTELAITMTKHKPQLVVVNYDKKKRILDGHILYESFISDAEISEPVLNEEKSIYDNTTLFFTSGTTGRQKCVPVTDINEVMSVNDVTIYLGVTQSDTILSLSSWSHRGGLHCCGPTVALYIGAAIVAADTAEVSQVLECIEKYCVSFISGMPSGLNALSKAQLAEKRNLASLKKIMSMGSTLSRDECITFQKTLCTQVYNCYGTTETFWNTILTPDKIAFYPGSVGEVCAGDEIRIVKIYDGREAEPDDIVEKDNRSEGEIIIKSCSKSAGYYESDNNFGSRYYKGFLYTRDIGVWGENGMITVVGRNDDIIICGEEKIYPEEIEEILMQNSKVSDCIVTSVTNSNGDEVVAAYIIKADRSLNFDELDKFCRDSLLLSENKRPRLYRFKRTLPYTSNGKKQHKKQSK